MRIKILLIVTALTTGLLVLAYGLYQRGLVRLNYPSHRRFPVRGIDVSHHQGSIDWRAVRSAGLEFAFIKATEGSDVQDAAFARNWNQAGEVGIARGAYHFFTFCTAGVAQARNFVQCAVALRGELPPAVDVEFSGNCAAPPAASEIRKELGLFMDEVERSSGRRPIVYFTRDAERRLLGRWFVTDLSWPRNILFEPRGSNWKVWQFAANGHVPGIATHVDLDLFNGTQADFAKWAHRGTLPPSPPLQ